jgi:predicted dehydrogenase
LSGKLDVGVIGAGTFGSMHLEAYSSYHRSNLRAICDLDEEKGRRLSEQYGCDYYSDYEEMISKAGLDAISVATPDFLHREPAICVAEAGLPLLLEKPMATTVDDAEAILDAFAGSGTKLMVDFHNRFSPPFVHLKRSIEEGEMGEPLFVQGRLNDTIYVPTGMLSWSSESSVLWFLGSHIIDLSRWLLSSDPVKVYAVEGRGVLSEMEINAADYYHSIITFESGAVANLENCWILPESHPSVYDLQLEFVGSKGGYNASASHTNMAEKFTAGKRENPDMLASIDIHGRKAGFAKYSIWHFVDCVLDDREPIASGEDGLWVTRTICRLLESSRSGKVVDL